jgi:hypothetical protein
MIIPQVTSGTFARLSIVTLLVGAFSIRCGGGDDHAGASGKDAGKKDGAAGLSDGSWAGSDAKGGSGGTLGGDGSASGGSGNPPACVLATHAYSSSGIEYATRFGKIWSFSSGVLAAGFPKDLTNVTRYASGAGPCSGKPAGGCGFDTLAFNSGGSEIVTAYGQKWSFLGDVLEAEFPKDLVSIQRYIDPGGPCEAASSLNCHFDTLAFDPAGPELVTAAGKIWSWNNGALDGGFPQDLTAISRYADATGPCANKTGANCHFDTMTFDSTGAEVVTASGKIWKFTAGVLDSGYPREIASIPYMSGAKNGPCI